MNTIVFIISIITILAIIAMQLVVNKKIVKAKSDKKPIVAIAKAKARITLSIDTKRFFSLFPRLVSKSNIVATKEGANLHSLNSIVKIFDAIDAKAAVSNLIDDYASSDNAVLYHYESLSKLALTARIGLSLNLVSEDIIRAYEYQAYNNAFDPKSLARVVIKDLLQENEDLKAELKKDISGIQIKAIHTQQNVNQKLINEANKIINSTNADSAIKRVDISTQLRRVSNHVVFSAFKVVAEKEGDQDLVDLCDEALKNITKIDSKAPPIVREESNLVITKDNKDILEQVFPDKKIV